MTTSDELRQRLEADMWDAAWAAKYDADERTIEICVAAVVSREERLLGRVREQRLALRLIECSGCRLLYELDDLQEVQPDGHDACPICVDHETTLTEVDCIAVPAAAWAAATAAAGEREAALRTALEAIHAPVERDGIDGAGQFVRVVACAGCTPGGGASHRIVQWPCPTVAALRDVLGGPT